MRRVLALALLMAACGRSVTDETPLTEAQVKAHEASFYWAGVKGVRLDAVIFAPGPITRQGRAAAWAVCDNYAIGWNEEYIETAQMDFDCTAAHEVCHIYYKDNLPCKKSYDESRAARCASALVGRGCGADQ